MIDGEILFEKGAKVAHFFFCQSGCVRLEVFPEKRKPVVLYRARADEAFAEEHLVLEEYSYRGVADEDSVVLMVPRQAILDDVRSNPDVAFRYIDCLAKRFLQLRINFERLGIKGAKQRVMHLLQTLSMRSEPPLDLSGKIKSLSDDLNLTHEATYRALRDLENDGVLKRSDGMFEIVSPPESPE